MKNMIAVIALFMAAVVVSGCSTYIGLVRKGETVELSHK